MQPLRAILFDHDGTLVDSEPIHFKLWKAILKSYGHEITETVFNQYYAGLPTIANAQDIVKRYAIEKNPEQIVEEKNALTKQYLSRDAYPLMNGVAKVLQNLHETGLTLGVVTGANLYSVGSTIRSHELSRYISCVITADDVKQSKPSPECYLLALNKLGLLAAACVAIEDTEHGVQAATAAGIRCIAIPTEISRHHDFSLAQTVVNNMTEAQAYIEEYCLHPLSS